MEGGPLFLFIPSFYFDIIYMSLSPPGSSARLSIGRTQLGFLGSSPSEVGKIWDGLDRSSVAYPAG